MATTDFTDLVTVIPTAWLNDIDAFYYELFGATGGKAYIGDTSNANMTIGLTINQGANDDEIVALKSSDVAHGMTDLAETDTFFSVRKQSGAVGGVQVIGYTETTQALDLVGRQTTADTTKSTAGVGAVTLYGQLKSAATVGDIGANGNVVAVVNNGTTRFILDSDGDSHQDVGTAWTNFDTHNDLALLDATSALMERDPGNLRKAFADDFLVSNKQKLSDLGIVTFNDNGHHFINWSRFQMLHMGATRWLGDKVAEMESRMLALEAK